MAAEMQMVNAVERFNRMSTELANERTLLAWVRTCLAAIRTAVAYLGLVTYAAPWHCTLLLAQGGMLALVILAAVEGAARYYRLKAVIEQKVTPRNFGRVSLRPLNAMVLVASVATASGIVAQEWHRG